MAQLPAAWLAGFMTREARLRPERVIVTLQLSYHPLYDPPKISKVDGMNLQGLETELQTILSFELRRKQQHRDVGYYIHTPRATLLVIPEERDGVVLARIKDVFKRQISLMPTVSPFVRAYLYELRQLVHYDMDQAYQAYQAAMKEERRAAHEAAYGELPRSPAQRLRDELDRQLIPARTILDLAVKRDQVTQAASAYGVVARENDTGEDGLPAPDILRIRIETLSGAFVEDTDVDLEPAGRTATIPAEIVEASGNEVLLRPKRPSDLARLPRPGTRVTLRRPDPKVNTSVAEAITRARQGTIVGDWDSLTRLLTAPATLDPVPAPDGSPAIPKLSLEQQNAVHRATATRQAFFIQGPPGTGKTTVITEIVRQLVQRGERVLLAAPMHVAVDAVLKKLLDEPSVWAMRVASDARRVDEKVRHLIADDLKASAVGAVQTRLSHPSQDRSTQIGQLQQRGVALQRFEDATTAHARLSESLQATQQSGRRRALEEEIGRSVAAVADITTEMSRADSAATAAQATLAETQPRLKQAEADAADASARLAGLRAAVQENESRHGGAEYDAAAARQRLSRTAQELARLDAHLADLRSRIETLREAHAGGWRQDVDSFRVYLASQQRGQLGRQAKHKSTMASTTAAADARVTSAETRIAELKRQQLEAEGEAARLSMAAESDRRRADLAVDATRRAEADYQALRSRTRVFGKLGDGFGVGELAKKRNEIADRNNDYAAARRDQQNNLGAAARARATAESIVPLLAAARQHLIETRQARAGLAERHAAKAAEVEMGLAALTRLQSWFAEDADLLVTQATLERVSREAATSGLLRDVAKESEIIAAAIRTRRQNTAAQLAADEAELERTRQSRSAAEKQQAQQTADLTRCDAAVMQARDPLARARDTEAAQAAVERQTRQTAAQLRASYQRTFAQWQDAVDSRAQLKAGLADHAEHQRAWQQRLAEVITEHDEMLARAAAAAQAAQDAHAAARDACGGRLPDDPAADLAAIPVQIRRIETLDRLGARWRELVEAAGATGADTAEELGQAVLDATNLVCTTVVGIGTSHAAKHADFDTLILDEASRVIDADFLVPAVRAGRWILVGDERQLPPYVDQETEQHVHALLALRAAEHDRISLETAVDRIAAIHDRLVPGHEIRRLPTAELATRTAQDGTWTAEYREHLDDELGKLGKELALRPGEGKEHDAVTALITALAVGQAQSRFEKCVSLPETTGVRAKLTMQRRMIAPIAELVREPVYRGEYHTPDEAELALRGIRPYTGRRYPEPVTFFDTQRSAQPSKLAGTGFVNEFEADLVVGVLHIWDKMAGQGGLPDQPTFSVLAFYKAQAALIERRLARRPLRRLKADVIDSIDKIQGQESDLVVISFVRALRTKQGRPKKPGPRVGLWLQDIHRLNVAATRARLALALVGDRPTLQNLRGNPEAEAFYANLFKLLDSRAPGIGYVADPVL
jgi:hypothetical protein